MSYRHLLWLLLGAAGLPLLFEATTGCSFIVDGKEENAYVCGCSCAVGDSLPQATPVEAGADDAVEALATSMVDAGATNLTLVQDTLVGLRFDDLAIPPGAAIESAHVQFVADEDGSDPTQITIRLQDAGNPLGFSETDGDLSDRATVAGLEVPWTPDGWTRGDADDAQKTPELQALLQAAVDRDDWSEANAVVLIFETASGERLAESFEDNDGEQPVLQVRFRATVSAQLPVCEAFKDDAKDSAKAMNDCGGRVAKTLDDAFKSCIGGETAAAASCTCKLLPLEEGNDDFAFEHAACKGDCPAVPLGDQCENFDPGGFVDCVEEDLDCSNPPCEISDACLAKVSATQTSDLPVCLAVEAGQESSPIAMSLFGQNSLCEVAGTSEILVGDGMAEPKKDPATRGQLTIQGRPCPLGTCPVGFSSMLSMDPISFDVKFARDPTFRDLFQAGGAHPGAAEVGGATPGLVPEGAALAVSVGRRGSDEGAFTGANDSPLALTVNWIGGHCALEGNLATTVDAEGLEGLCSGDDATVCILDEDCVDAGGVCVLPPDPEPLVVDVDLFGPLVNQPPTARAGDSRTEECTSPAGATFMLNGSSSIDPDDAGGGLGLFPDIRLASWRVGEGRFGEEIGSELKVSASLGIGESNTYRLLVMDSFAQSDTDTTTVLVVDTTPPEVFCNAPQTITPDQVPHKNDRDRPPLAFTGTAMDICDDSVTPEILGFDCFAIKKDGRILDKTSSCEVQIEGDTLTILDPGGIGDHIVWTLRAEDDSGRSREVDCEVEVVKKK